MNTVNKINNVCEIFKEDNPCPKTELNYVNEWTFSVAVILSAQSTDKRVNIQTKDLFEKYKTPDDFVKLGFDGLVPYIKSIGLYQNKGRNIIKSAEIITKEFNGKIPSQKEDLIKLPGIGIKTAGVIINELWKGNEIAVDTHVFRVSHRIGVIDNKFDTPEKTSLELEKIVPEKWKHHFSNWFVLHGRYICKAQNPDCQNCKVKKYCDFFKPQQS